MHENETSGGTTLFDVGHKSVKWRFLYIQNKLLVITNKMQTW